MVHEGTLKIGSLGLQHACLAEETDSEPSARTPTANNQGQKLGKSNGQLETYERTVACWHIKVFHRVKDNYLCGIAAYQNPAFHFLFVFPMCLFST